MATTGETRKIGRFTLTTNADGSLSVVGPAAYVGSERYRERIRRIEAGLDVVINSAPGGSDIVSLIGVSLQTDFAAWRGLQEMMRHR